MFVILSGTIKFENGYENTCTENAPELLYANLLVNSGITKIEFLDEGRILTMDSQAIELLLFDYTEMANCVLNCVEQFKLAG